MDKVTPLKVEDGINLVDSEIYVTLNLAWVGAALGDARHQAHRQRSSGVKKIKNKIVWTKTADLKNSEKN